MRSTNLLTCACILVVLTFQSAFSTIINVPDDYQTIQAAINAAEHGDTVLVADGEYSDHLDFSGKNLVVASHILLDGNEDHMEETIIDGGGREGSVVVFHGDENNNSLLKGFTIRNGRADLGAGILCDHVSPILENLIIEGNNYLENVHPQGVALACVNESSVTLRHSYIRNSQTESYYGVVNVDNASQLDMNNVHLYANATGDGMILFANNSSTINLWNVSVHENILPRQGVSSNAAITVYSSTLDAHDCIVRDNTSTGIGGYCGVSYLTDCIIENNSAYGLRGIDYHFFNLNHVTVRDNSSTGIYASRSVLDIADSEISGNGPTHQGGGIYLQFRRYFSSSIVRTSIINNTAARGGGICFDGDPGQNQTIQLVDVIIAGNSTVWRDDYNYYPGTGGGVWCNCSNGTVEMTRVQITGNTAYLGGAFAFLNAHTQVYSNLSVYGNMAESNGDVFYFINSNLTQLTINNSIFWQNGDDEPDLFNRGAQTPYTINIDYCDCDFDVDDMDLGEQAELDRGEHIIDSNPLFVDPDNGDFHLTEDSPCIDAGDPESDPDPDGTRADMGAYYFPQDEPRIAYYLYFSTYIPGIGQGPVMQISPLGEHVSEGEAFIIPDYNLDNYNLGESFQIYMNGISGTQVMIEEGGLTEDIEVHMVLHNLIVTGGIGQPYELVGIHSPAEPQEGELWMFAEMQIWSAGPDSARLDLEGLYEFEDGRNMYVSVPLDDDYYAIYQLLTLEYDIPGAAVWVGDFVDGEWDVDFLETCFVEGDPYDWFQVATPSSGYIGFGRDGGFVQLDHDPVVIHVPDDYETIQTAIDAAENGDTVLVAPGEYVENINFNGKNISVIGDPEHPENVVIDGNENGSVVTFANEETEDAVLTGFTIRNGDAEYGGGISIIGSSPTVNNCCIRDNSSIEVGGGISCINNSRPHILLSLIANNTSGNNGGGIYCSDNSNVEILNCTISGNNTDGSGNGLFLVHNSNSSIISTIIWGNNDPQIYLSFQNQGQDNSITISYSNIEDGQDGIFDEGGIIIWGEGNIDADPLFVDPDNGDFHLTANSPCIDAGDPESDPDPDGTRADMGAYYCEQDFSGLFEPDEHTVALWHFNEGEGHCARDVSGNDNHGEMHGEAGWGEGRWGTALVPHLGGTGYMSVPDHVSLKPEILTVECMFRTPANNDRGVILTKDIEGNLDSYKMSVSTREGQEEVEFSLVFQDAGHVALPAAINAGDNNWHQLVGTYDGSSMNLFYDGNPVATREIEDAIRYGDGYLIFGSEQHNPGEDTPFLGSIDEVRISSVVRIIPLPNIVISPASLDFGAVHVGESSEEILTISNTGDVNLIVSEMSTEAPFSFAFEGELPITIEPDGSVEVTVTFAPEDFGVYEGMLTVNSNDPNDEELAVDLTGFGLEEREFEICDGVSYTMVHVPAGSFMMGAQENEMDAEDDEYPQHRVRFENDFWVGKYEVTQAQWEAIMEYNPAWFQNDDYPVEMVSWEEIQRFEDSIDGIFRLPSESEWEYVCRAGHDNTCFWWGNDYEELGDYAWFNANAIGHGPHPVGEKEPNPWGLYDILGNVFEWCEDLNHDSYAGAPADGSAWIADGGQHRILRGGEWGQGPEHCRPANRNYNTPDWRWRNLGFRLVRSAGYSNIALSLESIDFGAVHVGESGEEILTISNTGDADLIVSEMSTEAPFSVEFDEENPITIEPDGSVEVTVTFAPEAVGVFEGMLSITSNDPDEEIIQVPLSGECPNRPPEIVGEIPDQELPQGFEPCPVAQLNRVFTDPDGDELTFDASSDNENLNAFIDGDDLWLSVDGDWTGETDVTIVADDGHNPDQDRGPVRNLRSTQYESPTAVFNPAAAKEPVRSIRNLRSVAVNSASTETTLHRDDTVELTFHVTVVPDDVPPWEVVEPTGITHNLLIEEAIIYTPREEARPLADRSWIGAFVASPNGEDSLCVGAVNWQNQGDNEIVAIGDNPEQEGVSGFTEGQSIHFRVYENDIEYLARSRFENDEELRVYTPNGDTRLAVDAGGRGLEEIPLDNFDPIWHEDASDHSILVQNPMLNDEPLEIGDEIAVFTPGGLCVGATVWLHYLGEEQWFEYMQLGIIAIADSDQELDEIDGFINGERMLFQVWDQSENASYPGIAEVNEGDEHFVINGSTLLNLTAPIYEQRIALRAGWQMISTNLVDLCTDDIVEIWMDVVGRDHLDISKNQDGRFYTPFWGNYNDIPFWNTPEGYWAKIVEPDTLILQGRNQVEPDGIIQLRRNWNIVAYYPQIPVVGADQVPNAFLIVQNDDDRLAPMDEAMLVMAKDDRGRFYAPDWHYNDIPAVEPTKGYQVKVTESTDFVWNVEDQPAAFIPYRQIQSESHRFIEPEPTGSNMSLLVTSSDHLSENLAGAELGVFTAKGLCVGSVILSTTGNGCLTRNQWGMAIWGDDPTTDEQVEGALEGDNLIFKLWDGNSEYLITPEFLEGVPVYTKDGFAVISISNVEIPCQFELTSIHPNPFNSTTTIKYSLDRETRISIRIFDLQGREVAVVFEGQRQSGNYRQVFQADNLSSGVYFCRIKDASNRQHIRKMVLVR